MADDPHDTHLAPAQPEPEPERPSRFGLTPFVRDIGRFVRLAERQGTRLVDLIERWVEAAEESNRVASRLADSADRLATHADVYLGAGEYPDDDVDGSDDEVGAE